MNIADQLVRPNIRDLLPYSSARDEFTGEDYIFMDANENPYDSGLNRYPDPSQEKLKKKISEIKQIDTNRIFLGNGSDEAIDLLMRAFGIPAKDKILQLTPTYGMYKVCADINDLSTVSIPLDASFGIDTQRVIDKADSNSKLIFICSPNNPTGNLMDSEDILRLCTELRSIIVVDEAYIDFSGNGSMLEFIGHYDTLVVLQTFSKAWGMAGIRLGMAFASVRIIEILNKIKYPYNINQLTIERTLSAFESGQKDYQVKEIIKERKKVEKQLRGFSFVEHIYPSDANFLLVKFQDAGKIYRYLLENGVVVRNRSNVPGCEGCLRITIGIPDENEKLLSNLRKI